jgi:autotransporter-associated beta strand protein
MRLVATMVSSHFKKRLFLTVGMAILLALCSSSSFANSTWQGANGANWSAASNWNGGEPISTSVVYLNGSAGTVNLDTTATVKQLFLTATGSVGWTIANGGGSLMMNNTGGDDFFSSGNVVNTVNAPLSASAADSENFYVTTGNTLAVTNPTGANGFVFSSSNPTAASNGVFALDNAWSAATTGQVLRAGTIDIGNSSALGTAGTAITIADKYGTAGCYAALLIDGSGNGMTFTKSMSGGGSAAQMFFTLGALPGSSGTYSGAIALATNTVLTISASTGSTVAITGGLSGGSSAVSIPGGGLVALTGSYSTMYSVPTTLTAGTLQVLQGTGFQSSSVSVSSGATMIYNVTGGASSSTYINLDNASGKPVATTGAGVVQIFGTGFSSFGLSAANADTFNMSAGAWFDVEGGDIQFGNGKNAFLSNYGSLNVAASASYHNSDGSFVFDSLTGSGTVGTAYNNAATITLGIAGDVNSTAYGVANNTAIFYGTLKDKESYDNQTTGALSVIKTGTGTQIFANAMTYSGSTLITGGTLQLGTGIGGQDGSLVNTTKVSDNAALVYDLTGNQSVAYSVTGGGVVSTVGSSVLTFSKSNNYSGGTNIGGGTLQVGNALALGGSNAGPLTISGGTLDLAGFSPTAAGNMSLNLVSGAIMNSGTAASLTATGYTLQSGAISAVLAGSGAALNKTSGGLVTLSASNTYGGGTTVGAGTLALGAAGTLGSGNVTITPGATLDVSAYGSGYTFKPGTLLSAGRTGTPGTDINGSVNINTSTLTQSASNSTLTISNGNLSLSSGTISFNPYDQISVGGSLALTGTEYITPTTALSGTYTLFTFNSLSGGTSDLATAGANGTNSRQSYVFAVSGGTAITLTVSGNPGALLWTGSTSSIWDTTTTPNWYNVSTGTADLFHTGDNVTFSDSRAATGNVTINSLVSPANLTVSNSAVNYTFSGSGSIGGGTSLIKSGPGTLTLNSSNSYTGGTNLSGGLVNASAAYGLGYGTLTVSSGTLNAAAAQDVGAVVVNGGLVTASAAQALGPSGVTVSGGMVIASAAQALGTGAVTISGGTLTANAAQSPLSVTLNSGLFNLGSGSAAGSGLLTITGGSLDNTTGSSLTLSTNNPQNWNGNFTFNGSSGLNMGSGAITLGGNTQLTVSSNTLTVGGNIAGLTYGLTKAGSGVLTLTGTSSYTGGTTLSAGQLDLNSPQAIGIGSFTVAGGSIDNTSGSTVNLSGVSSQNWNADFIFYGTNNLNFGTGPVTLSGSRQVTVNAGTLTVGGLSGSTFGLTKLGAGKLIIGGASTYSGATTVSAGTLQFTNGNACSSPSAYIAAGAALEMNAPVNIYTQTAITYTGPGVISKTGTGMWLTGATGVSGGGTYVGGLNTSGAVYQTVSFQQSAGGVFDVENGDINALFSTQFPSNNLGSLNVSSSGRFFSGVATQFDSLTGSGQIASGYFGNTMTLTIGAGNNATNAYGVSNNTATFYGTILDGEVYNGHNSLALSLIKIGSGTQILDGTDTYSGSTTVNGGTLQLASATALPSGDVTTVNSLLELSGYSASLNSLSGSGTIDTNLPGSSPLLTISGTTAVTTFSGVIQNSAGTLALFKTGPATLVLSGSNTYTGGTTINSGTLQLGDGTLHAGSVVGNIMDNGMLTLANPGTQTYSGFISGNGSLTMNSLGLTSLAGSNSYAGSTTVSRGTLQLGAATALPAGTSVAVNGTLDLSGNNASITNLSGSGTIDSTAAGSPLLTIAPAASSVFAGTLKNSAGSLSVFLTGGNSLTLTGSSTYSGRTTIDASTTLQLGDGLSHNGALAGNIVNNGTLVLNNPHSQVYAGSISGSGGLNMTGGSVQTLSGSNTFSGPVLLSSGTLQLGSSAALPVGAAVAFINYGTVLDLNTQSANISSLSGYGTIDTLAGGTPTLTIGTGNASNVFAGVLQNSSGSLALVKTGSGLLNLSGYNTYGGPTTVAGGVLYAGAYNALSANSAVTVTSGTLDVTYGQQSIASLSVGLSGVLNLAYNNLLTSNGTVNFAAGSTLNITDNTSGTLPEILMDYASATGKFTNVTYNGSPLPGSEMLSYSGSMLELVQSSTGSSGSGSSGPVAWNASAGGSWAAGSNWSTASVPSGIGTQVILGSTLLTSGTVTLDGAQTVGTLTFNSSASYTLSSGSGGSLTLDNTGGTIGGQIIVLSGSHSISAPLIISNSAAYISLAGSGSLDISGDISQSGGSHSLSLSSPDGSGMLSLDGSNSFSGGVFVNSGTLILNGASALAQGSTLVIGTTVPASTPSLIASPSAGPSLSLAPVPEPGTLLMLVVGAAIVAVIAVRRSVKTVHSF